MPTAPFLGPPDSWAGKAVGLLTTKDMSAPDSPWVPRGRGGAELSLSHSSAQQRAVSLCRLPTAATKACALHQSSSCSRDVSDPLLAAIRALLCLTAWGKVLDTAELIFLHSPDPPLPSFQLLNALPGARAPKLALSIRGASLAVPSTGAPPLPRSCWPHHC